MHISRKPVVRLLIALAVVFLAYGQTLRMYFWQDDLALIFKLQHPAENMGSFGAGIIGSGPYKYLATPFVPFYQLFGSEPLGYFAVGLVIYIFATLVFWLFSRELIREKSAAFVAVLFFAAGYVGSDIMFRIINSWQTNIGHILNFLALWQLERFHRRGRALNYFAALILFWASIEFVFVRTHSFILSIFALGLILTLQSGLKSVPKFVLRQAPFWGIFAYRYLLSAPQGSSAVSGVFVALLAGKWEYFAPFFATIGNGFVPMQIQSIILEHFQTSFSAILFGVFAIVILLAGFIPTRSYKFGMAGLMLLATAYLFNKHNYNLNVYWYRGEEALLSGAIGLYIVSALIIFTISAWRKYRAAAKTVLLGLLIYTSQIIGYFIEYPESIWSTTHRYLSNSISGYALIWAGIFLFLYTKYKGRKLAYATLFVVALNLILGIRYQHFIVKHRSTPARQFYASLLTYTPEISPGSIFYFDVKHDNNHTQRFREFFSVGSMPETTALAMHYTDIDRDDIYIAENFNELLRLSVDNLGFPDNVFTYYYGVNGLTDTTHETRERLVSGSPETMLAVPELKIPISPETTSLFTVSARLSVDYTKLGGAESAVPVKTELKDYTEYLSQENNYYQSVETSSESEWRYQEHEYAADADPETSWRGHRIHWHNSSHDYLMLDLSVIRAISKVVWINWTHTSTPTKYAILLSEDGINWTEVYREEDGSERTGGEIVQLDIPQTAARYVQMEIFKTLSGDSPAISELIPISGFPHLNYKDIVVFKSDPFSLTDTIQEKRYLAGIVAPHYPVELKVQTDKWHQNLTVVAEAFEKPISYEFVIPAGGTEIISVELAVPDEFVNIDILSASVRALSLEELKQSGLVPRFADN